MLSASKNLFAQLTLDQGSWRHLREGVREVLTDGLPGTVADEAAKKIRRGVYLTSFNALESVLKDVAVLFSDRITDLNIPLDAISQKATSDVFNGISEALNATPRWCTFDEKVVREWQYASMMDNFYLRKKVVVSGEQFFRGSNVTFSDLENAATLFRGLHSSILDKPVKGPGVPQNLPRFLQQFFTLADPDIIKVSKSYLTPCEDLTQNKFVPKLVYGNISRIRNRSAHSSECSPSVEEIDFLVRSQRLFACGFYAYLLSVASFIDRKIGPSKTYIDSIEVCFPDEFAFPRLTVDDNLKCSS